MTDFPPGDWSPLLVGHQWPDTATLSLLAAAADSRGAVCSGQETYAEELRAVRMRNLGTQEGLAADAAREMFRTGEQLSRAIAARNLAKQQAYRSADEAVRQLRADLEDIAAQGNTAIELVLQSSQGTAAKVNAIVAIVTGAHEQCNACAADRCADVVAAIHRILDADSAGQSAQQLASLHGIALPVFGSVALQGIHADVARMVSGPAAPSRASSGR